MLRQRATLVAWGLYVVDLAVLVASFLLAYWVRDTYLSRRYDSLAPLSWYVGVVASSALIWSFLLVWFRLYTSYRTKSRWTETLAMLKVCFFGTLAVSALTFALKLGFVSRILIVTFGATAFVLLSMERVVIRMATRLVRLRGYNWRNVLIIGTSSRAREVAALVEEQRHWGLRLLGFVPEKSTGCPPRSFEYPVVGTIDEMPEILRSRVVDEVIFAVSRRKLEKMEGLFLLCEELGIQAHVAVTFFFPHMIAKVHVDDLHGIPLLTFTTTPQNEFLLALKRCVDVLVSLVMLAVLAPLLLAIALAIKVGSPGPVLFRQQRVGLNGRQFTLYKYRSMVPDAEARKQDLLHLNEMSGPVFKMKDDPRLTRVGKFLRRTSFDEFPQLLNVLGGSMSLVGPRPPLPEEVAKYEPWQRRRLSMKPGLTCLWQVSGRNRITDFDRWMELDLRYIDNWSFKLDLLIFFKTIPVVLLGKGAT